MKTVLTELDGERGVGVRSFFLAGMNKLICCTPQPRLLQPQDDVASGLPHKASMKPGWDGRTSGRNGIVPCDCPSATSVTMCVAGTEDCLALGSAKVAYFSPRPYIKSFDSPGLGSGPIEIS